MKIWPRNWISSRDGRISRRLRRAALAVLGIAAASLSCTPNSRAAGAARATFAGGCFWCMEEAFEKLPGVISVASGFTGGSSEKPTSEVMSSGRSGHAEAVEIVFDPSRIPYERLLDTFWHNVDPLTSDGQFCDRGRQYRSAIFYHGEEQRRLAEESKRRAAQELQATVVTEIAPASAFYPAEASQQDFYRKNPARYHEYVEGCGRHRRLQQLWGNAAGHAD